MKTLPNSMTMGAKTDEGAVSTSTRTSATAVMTTPSVAATTAGENPTMRATLTKTRTTDITNDGTMPTPIVPEPVAQNTALTGGHQSTRPTNRAGTSPANESANTSATAHHAPMTTVAIASVTGTENTSAAPATAKTALLKRPPSPRGTEAVPRPLAHHPRTLHPTRATNTPPSTTATGNGAAGTTTPARSTATAVPIATTHTPMPMPRAPRAGKRAVRLPTQNLHSRLVMPRLPRQMQTARLTPRK